jgi:hypothetical protein
MKRKSAGLSQFIEDNGTPAEEPPRKRGKGAVVGLTVRLSRDQWRVVHDAALSEGIAISELFIKALSERLQAKGLPPL